MIPSIGTIRLGQVLFAVGCLAAQAQTLVKKDDGSGVLTMLFKQPLWPNPNIHYNAYDGAGWTSVPGIPMRKSTHANFSADEGWWEYSLKTSEFEFVFNDNNGLWDNNDNANYKVNSAGTWSVVSKITTAPTPPPPSYISGSGYKVTSVKQSGDRTQLVLAVNTPSGTTYGEDIKELTADFFLSKDSVRVKITDKNSKRWEVPRSLYGKTTTFARDPQSTVGQGQGQGQGQGGANNYNVAFTYTSNPFSFKVTRKSDNYVLFDSSALDLVIKDQYLQIATTVPSDLNVYGIGESTRGSVKLYPGEKHTLWARDTGSFDKNVNTYGSHPFYLGLNGAGKAHGVLLLNSNGMDITVDDGRLIYQTIGGILDFNIVSGPTPADVLGQYTSLIGKPKLMPYWSYGYHQCRWGYNNVSALQEVVSKYDANQIPLDVIWADIDYMNKFYDFTLDPVNFPEAEMGKFLAGVHAEDKKFVPIIDPGIPDDSKDIAYNRGLELDVFIKDTTGKPYLGQVWPGPTVFPDFFHPNSTGYWGEQLERMHKMLPYDGLWIDMNELANFCPGTVCVREAGVECPRAGSLTTCCLKCADDGNQWNNPPFSINNGNGRDRLYNKAISTSSLQYGNIRQYDSHNLYGLTEAIATNALQEKVLGKRSFVLSRSTFPGSGAHAAHWTGDNAAQWNDLLWSVTTIQKFGLFGIPMVGADICGFAGNSNAELCARWTALGAFYPFARNHNNLQSIPQETYVWPEVAAVGRKFIGMRYRLLPYIYTAGYQATVSGTPIARPLFFEFPLDAAVRAGIALERQYLLGSSLLVIPVVYKGVTNINGYVPAGTWYNLFDYSRVESTGQEITWDVKLDDMPVLIRGGSILPLHQGGSLTSAAARKTPFDLLVALPSSGAGATGQLFLDDGEDLSGSAKATIVEFKAEVKSTGTTFTSQVGVNKYADAKSSKVKKLVVLGVKAAPTNVVVNDSTKLTTFTYSAATQQLEVDLSPLNLSIVDKFSVSWN